MPSSDPGPALPLTDLTKLTVPQLKAICKEHKITGYSKLSKNVLIQKLTECRSKAAHNVPTKTSVANAGGAGDWGLGVSPGDMTSAVISANVQAKPSSSVLTTTATKKPKARTNQPITTPSVRTGTAASETDLIRLPSSSNVTPEPLGVISESGPPLLERVSPLLADLGRPLSPKILSAVSVVSVDSSVPGTAIQTFKTTSRHTPSSISAAGPSSSIVVQPTTGSEQVVPTKRTSQSCFAPLKKQKTKRNVPESDSSLSTNMRPPSVFKRPVLPPHLPVITSLPAKPLPVSVATSAASAIIASSQTPVPLHSQAQSVTTNSCGKRFKKLVVVPRDKLGAEFLAVSSETPLSIAHHVQSQTDQGRGEDTSPHYYLDFPPGPSIPTLVPITLPPSLSQRKRVQRWAVILSGLSDEERRRCILVCRMFRYAVYLSASHLLTRHYSGERLKRDVTQRYPQAMTNMWPYFRLREQETAQRQQAFQDSFLTAFIGSVSLPNPIAKRLWVSPDNERQITIALRFVMSRLWFALSIGTGAGDLKAFSWLCGTVVDAQPVIKDEIWSITISPAPSDQSSRKEVVYVLEATCEVVGHASSHRPSTSQAGLEMVSVPIRADWSSYITQRATLPAHVSSGRLFDLLKWANYEEYDHGISRLWLKRMMGEGALGVAKRIVAERYVLACVVANSVSGEWLSVSEMAQDFAGLPARTGLCAHRKLPSVNLYLPGHHHVESVHFTTSGGRQLHPALAVVQTPHREYYILRDNGMQVGCEEDGVASVWQQVLQCTELGV